MSGQQFSVRRLAAIDMWGGQGSTLRRRIILLEFLVGTLGGIALGVWMLAGPSNLFSTLLGIWAIGVGVNYIPLAIYAITFSPAGALERELDGVDIWSELRHYTLAQFRVLVPFLIAFIALRERR